MEYKIVIKEGAVKEDVLDQIDISVINYMKGRRNLDEPGMRDLMHNNPDVFASYLRKVARCVNYLIGSGTLSPAFFGRKA